MPAPNTYVIRLAVPADRSILHRIARLDTQRPLTGEALVGEIGGVPAAAIALGDGRVIADPFMRTASVTALLRLRLRAYHTNERKLSLLDRIRAGLRARAAAEV